MQKDLLIVLLIGLLRKQHLIRMKYHIDSDVSFSIFMFFLI